MEKADPHISRQMITFKLLKRKHENRPDYKVLPQFILEAPRTNTFKGCVQISSYGRIAFRLFCEDRNPELQRDIGIMWRVLLQDKSGTEKEYPVRTLQLDHVRSPYTESEWNKTNSVEICDDITTSGDAVHMEWTLEATPTGESIASIIKMKVDSSLPTEPVRKSDSEKPRREGADCDEEPPKYFCLHKPDREGEDEVPRESYEMDARPRGNCLVINITFNNDEFKKRHGSKEDADALKQTFEKLHFKVSVHNELTKDEVLDVMKKAASDEKNKSYNCLVCCILSHGGNGYVEGVDGQQIRISEILSIFSPENCQSLSGKPKLIFIEGCRGKKVLRVNPERDVQTDTADIFSAGPVDFLIGYATVAGYVSFRATSEGSYYIQELTEMLNKYATKEDIQNVLTRVTGRVTKVLLSSKDDEVSGQVPVFNSTLSKQLIFSDCCNK